MTAAEALKHLAEKAETHAAESAYALGLANGLRLAHSTATGAPFEQIPAPAVYTNELQEWGGRYRWMRSKGCGVLRAGWLAWRA